MGKAGRQVGMRGGWASRWVGKWEQEVGKVTRGSGKGDKRWVSGNERWVGEWEQEVGG